MRATGLILSPQETECTAGGAQSDDIVRRNLVNHRFPLERLGSAGDMADAALFLVAGSSATGLMREIDAGCTVVRLAAWAGRVFLEVNKRGE